MTTRLALSTTLTMMLALPAGRPAAAPPKERLIARIDRIWCGDLLALGQDDFTARPARPAAGGPAAWLRYLGRVAQSRHDRRAWRQTQNEAVGLWDEVFAREGLGPGWRADYVDARQALDERATRWLGTEVKNPAQMVALFGRLSEELRRLRRENDRQLDPADATKRLATALIRAEPTLPRDVGARLGRERELRDLLARDLRLAERMRRAGVARSPLAESYALLAAGLTPSEVASTRVALAQLGPKSRGDRAQILADVAEVPLFGRVLREAARPLPDRVTLKAPEPPVPPAEIKPRATPWPWRRAGERRRAARLNAERAAAFAEATMLYRRERQAFETGPALAEARRALDEARRYRGIARAVVRTYLAYRQPGAFESDDARAAQTRVVDWAVEQVEARPETPTQDVEMILTDVVMALGERPWLRPVLKAALILMPRLMDPDASLAHLVVPGEP